MGKRLRHGGRSPSGSGMDRRLLIRRIQSSNLDTTDPDAAIQHLRAHFPDYARHKLQPFALRVHQTIEFLKNRKIVQRDDDDDEDGGEHGTVGTTTPNSSSYKRLSREEIYERRLRRMESEHRRTRRQLEQSSDDSTSTSDDAVFEAQIDPEIDLTKSMLRESYGTLKPKQLKQREEDNMEIEAAAEKPKRTMVNGGGSGVEDGLPFARKGSIGGEVGKGVGGREGPMFRDLGGIKAVLEELMMEVIVPLCHPQLPRLLGVRPMAGILLHGPPGCGKTKVAHAIANETGVPFYKISAPEIVSGVSGASEENIRDLFKKAYRTAPSIVFIDEIDAIASKRENLQREMERRIVTQLMTCMDESHQTLNSTKDAEVDSETLERKPGYVLVIGATNRPDAVDQALRRPGRFDREIVLGVPDECGRVEILSVITRNLKLEGDFDLLKIARSTPGFVGADLAALVNKAGNLAMKRIIDRRKSETFCESIEGKPTEDWWRRPWDPEEMEKLSITMTDFEEAAKLVQPSSTREGFSSIPDVKWEDVGGLTLLRKEFDRYIIRRIRNPELYKKFSVNFQPGFLLYGPPGCGKTLIAKAVASEAGANFIHIKGPELLNKYVGESELAVRTIFTRARTCSPCILFFDEVDALTTKRGKDGGWVVERLLNQLLIELDGAGQRCDVYVIGATNRPEVMDPAVLRPGRFGKALYVPLPSAEERGSILKALARKKPMAADINFDLFGRSEACDDLTGADLAAVMEEAALAALEEEHLTVDAGSSTEPSLIRERHLKQALTKISPSVSRKQNIYYEAFSQKYTSLR